MRKVKKVLAMILALAMVLGTTLTAFAATGEGKITITGAGIEEATLSYVQVIRAEPTTKTGWKFNSNSIALAYITAFGIGSEYTDDNEQAAIGKLIEVAKRESVSSSAEIRTALNTVANQETFKAFTNGSAAPNGAGIYAIKAVQEKYTYNMMAAYVGFGEATDGSYPELGSVELGAKRVEMTIEKTDTDEDKVVNVGDVVTFNINAVVPAIGTGELIDNTFLIFDEISGAEYYLTSNEGETPVAIASVKMGDQELTIDGKSGADLFKIDGNNKFSIDLSSLVIANNENAGKAIVVTYTAKVTDVTVDNKVYAGHKDSTLDNAIYGKDEDKLITGEIVITKQGDESVLLSGAEFIVYKENDNTKIYAMFNKAQENKFTGWTLKEEDATHIETGADGTAKVQGLDAGYVYKFKEVKAPEGYSVNTTDATASWGAIPEVKDTPVKGTASMTDTKLSSLPSTGGIGTTIFTIGGCAIMIAAAGFFFISRRKSAKK